VILLSLIKKEFKEIIRDPVTLATSVFLPMVMLFLFGYAISLDVEHVPMAVYDADRTQESVRFIEAFTSGRYFTLKYYLDSPGQGDDLLLKGKAEMVLVIPPDFSKDLHSLRGTTVQILIDGTFTATALIVSNYASTIVNTYSVEFLGHALSARGLEFKTPVKVLPRVWYNPALSSVNYIVPGLFAVLLMAFPPLLSALSIVREKERGTIEQIYVSPVQPTVFILGKIFPYGLIAFADMLLILTTGTIWFHVPFKGSIIILMATSVIYVFTTIAIGLLVSTLVKTQLAAVLLSLIVTLMPSFLFSGFLFPIGSMPYVMQLYTFIFPARYFTHITRGVYLKGIGLEYLWGNVLLLLVYGIVLFVLASMRFKKKVA
jgi:ABC-2 type transport system permease protein